MRFVRLFIVSLLTMILVDCKEDSATNDLEAPSISGIAPNEIAPGQQGARATITGMNFVGIVAVDMGADIAITNTNLLDSTKIEVQFNVSSSAQPGLRNIKVATMHGVANAEILTVRAVLSPVARFDASKRRAIPGETLTFDASASSDPDGTIESYEWDFGDGKADTGKTSEHKYETSGNFNVTLKVTDNSQASSTASRNIEIKKVSAPVAAFTYSPASGEVGTNFRFDASSSSDDGRIREFAWNFGDGSQDKGRIVQHTYSAAGSYPVELSTTDNHDLKANHQKTIDVSGPAAPPPGGIECKTPARRGPAHYGTILSADSATKTVVIRLDEPASCDTAFYRCGDIRKGGDPDPPELWVGVICRMWDLGNNTFKVQLTLGKYWPSPGERGTYLWFASCAHGDPC